LKRLGIAVLCLCVGGALTGCATQNKYEHEADTITRAVMANDAAAVQKEFAPGIPITRVRVASYADELDAQGKLVSVKEQTQCTPGYHCILVKFEKNVYLERLQLNDQNQVTSWTFHMMQPGSAT
jgi:hypothetical protein